MCLALCVFRPLSLFATYGNRLTAPGAVAGIESRCSVPPRAMTPGSGWRMGISSCHEPTFDSLKVTRFITESYMPGLLPDVDPDGLLEYSVVYTDRALDHMSARFHKVMCDISSLLKRVYHAHSAVIVPGSGTFGMEAVARQFANDRLCLMVRNG